MKFPSYPLGCAFGVTLVLSLLAPALPGAEIVGRVTNGTSGRPVPGQFVNLMALRGQMVPVRETETDAEGRFRFVVAANPSERFLVQVPFQGVIYTQPAMFTSGERITADVEVFEAGARPEEVSVESHTIFLEPHSGHVRVNEFYAVRNHGRPLRTFAPEGGSFRFALPGEVGDLQVSAGRPGGMPLRQQPQPSDRKNTYAIDFALKPGESEIQLSYVLPMSGTTFELSLPLPVPAAQRHIAVPRQGVKLQASGVREIEQSQAPQVRVYEVAQQPSSSVALRLEVDPAALEAASAAQPAPEAAPTSESQVEIVPHPVSRAQWYIVALVLFILSLGLYYLYSVQPAPGSTDASALPPRPSSARSRHEAGD